jgi:hypothetical protein
MVWNPRLQWVIISAGITEQRLDDKAMTQATDSDIKEIRDLILGLDKKIDGLDKKVDVFSARTDERLKALETQVSDLKKGTDIQFADLKKSTDTQLADIRVQLRSQDNRLWTFVAGAFLTILGFLAKFAFFPEGQA